MNWLVALASTAHYCTRSLDHNVNFTSIAFDFGRNLTATMSPTEGNTSRRFFAASSCGPSSKMAIRTLRSTYRRMTSLSQTQRKSTSQSAQCWNWNPTYGIKPPLFGRCSPCNGHETPMPFRPQQRTRQRQPWSCRPHTYSWEVSPHRRWCQCYLREQQRNTLRHNREPHASQASSARLIYTPSYGRQWSRTLFETKALC